MRWYVVETHAKVEAKALFNLKRQGFRAYLPQYLKHRRHARRTDKVARPLFPRYLFVKLEIDRETWRPIQSTFGVVRLVCHGDRPAPVPNGVVEDIAARQNDDGFIAVRPACSYSKGEPVHIGGGAFADQTGLFECATDDERVVLLLNLLGREVKVKVPVEDLAAAG